MHGVDSSLQTDSGTASGAAKAADLCSVCSDALAANWSGQLYRCRICERCRREFARRRKWAFVIDLLLFACLGAFINILLWFVNDATLQRMIENGSPLIFIIFLLKDGLNGQSPGKRMFDLQVVDQKTGVAGGFVASLLRNIATIYLPFTLFILAELKFGLRIGDGMAKTKVVWKQHRDKAPFLPPLSNCYECGYDMTGNVSGKCPECGTPSLGSSN